MSRAYDTPDSISSCMLVNIIVHITDLTFIFTCLFSRVISSCSFKVSVSDIFKGLRHQAWQTFPKLHPPPFTTSHLIHNDTQRDHHSASNKNPRT